MLKKTQLFSLLLCISSLPACTSYGPSSTSSYQYSTEDTQLYPAKYESNIYLSDQYQESKQVIVPESYHMGANHSPTTHTDRDRSWMNSQNSEGYTIELGNSDKASEVAKTLYKAPKNDRMAEIKYQKEGKTYYKGLYGSYPTLEAAEQALKALPEDVKQTAGVKTWGSVKTGVGE